MESEKSSSNSVSDNQGSRITMLAEIETIIASGGYMRQGVLVKIAPTTEPEEIAEVINGEMLELLPEISVARILLSESLGTKEAVEILNQSKLVQYAEPNELCFIHSIVFTPNEPVYEKSQWTIQLTGLGNVWVMLLAKNNYCYN